MEWALFRSDNAKEHHIAGGQIRIFGLSRQASGQQDGEFHSKKKKSSIKKLQTSKLDYNIPATLPWKLTLM